MKDIYNDGYKTEDIKCIVVDFIAKDGKGGFPIMRQGIYVLCKDCKYWAEAGREYNPNTNSWSAVMVCDYDECPEGCGHTCWSTDADDFCSRGVKR